MCSLTWTYIICICDKSIFLMLKLSWSLIWAEQLFSYDISLMLQCFNVTSMVLWSFWETVTDTMIKALCKGTFRLAPVSSDKIFILIILGPVVQSVVSLTTSLRVISLTVLADPIHNILIFFAEKMWVAFALQKLLTFFQQKISEYLRITRCKF